jgi:G:T-mismatch repair DNA endonuclease (very short patch repair protein)
MGWEFLVVWECEIHMKEAVTAKLVAFLGPACYGKSLPRTASGS